MELLRFYYLFVQFVEYLFLVPLVLGLWKWKKLDTALRWIVVYLFFDFAITLYANYVYRVLHANNLYLFYAYSFFWNVTVCGFFNTIGQYKKEIIVLLVLGCIVVGWDYISNAGDMVMNYRSGLVINLVLFTSSTIFLFNKLDKTEPSSSLLFILLALAVQFLVRSVDIFFKKYLLESVYYTVSWFYETIIYYYVMLLAAVIFTYAFYLIRR
jgi:hypothetical protein